MNKDSHLIFEAYKNKLISEAPVEMGEYSGTGEEIKANFPEQSQGKYDLTPEETSQVFSNFLNTFKAKGGKSPKLYKDFYELELAPVVREIKQSINNTNSKYTARVLYNALKEAGVLKDERDGVAMSKKPSEKGIEKLTKFTIKNAGKLDKEDAEAKDTSSAGAGIDDPIMKRFWEKILGEGSYQKEELARMMIEDNPEARFNISALIRTGYLKKMDDGYEAVDPEEVSDKEEKEGEGSGEITSGYDPDEVDDLDRDPYGGVYVGRAKGDTPWD